MNDNSISMAPAVSVPTRWWQWVLVYPAIAISVITSMPTFVDKARAAATNLTKRDDQPAITSFSDAQMQKDMWVRNKNCDTTQHSWQDTDIGLKVDVTICPATGDVMVQALDANHKWHARWLATKEQIIEPDDGSGNTAKNDFNLISKARADTVINLSKIYKNDDSSYNYFKLAQFQMQPQMICQRQIDGRTLLRRLSTPQGCFDILIDMYTGQMIRQTPAPCIPQC